MTNKKRNAAPDIELPAGKPNAEGLREVLIISGTKVLAGLEEGEVWKGTYLGKVSRESTFGDVNLHLVQDKETGEVSARWGSHCLDEGLGRVKPGLYIEATGRGFATLDGGKRMRLVRILRGSTVDELAPVIDEEEAREQADDVYRALGYEPEDVAAIVRKYKMGELVEAETDPAGDIFPDLNS